MQEIKNKIIKLLKKYALRLTHGRKITEEIRLRIANFVKQNGIAPNCIMINPEIYDFLVYEIDPYRDPNNKENRKAFLFGCQIIITDAVKIGVGLVEVER